SPAVTGAGPLLRTDVGFSLGAARFDSAGRLVRLGDLDIDGLRPDVWRAPTDNDRGGEEPVERAWRSMGLHRTRHRLVEVSHDSESLLVRTRVGVAGHDRALFADHHWRAEGDSVRLTFGVTPHGDWPHPLPRLGLRMELPQHLDTVRWYGLGPGEAYPDSRRAGRVGRFTRTVSEMQTPYVLPQENGHRADVRWAELTGPDGSGLRVRGQELFGLTVRRWTNEDLDAARHLPDLVPGENIHLTLDLAQHGLGSASCGPGVLPAYALTAVPMETSFVFSPLTS
ncbi:beta-galactosidase small subunit, partial [Streptomyces spongiae]